MPAESLVKIPDHLTWPEVNIIPERKTVISWSRADERK